MKNCNKIDKLQYNLIKGLDHLLIDNLNLKAYSGRGYNFHIHKKVGKNLTGTFHI